MADVGPRQALAGGAGPSVVVRTVPGFFAGICLLQWQAVLPPWYLPVLGLFAGLVLLGLRKGGWSPPALAVGFALAWVHAAAGLAGVLPSRLEGLDLTVVGTVADLPEIRGGSSRFLFDIESAELAGGDARFSGRVRLTWYRDAPGLVAGERRRVRVRLKAPHGLANPGGFDYEGWLFQQGIRATGYVKGEGGNGSVQDPGRSRYLVPRLRQAIGDQLRSALGDSDGAGVVAALVLGDRSGIPRWQWQALTLTGTNHLIAISGLHVGILAALAFFAGRRLWGASVTLGRRVAADQAGAFLALGAAGGYAALAGFAISTQRALIMLAVVLGAVALRRTLRPGSGLLAALGVVVSIDPMAVLSYGFWLSFGAVAILLYGMGRRVSGGGVLWRWGRAQWLVALGLAPLLLLLFGRTSLVSPLANLVAVPLFSSLLLPAVLAATLLSLTFGLDWPLRQMADLLVHLLRGLEAAAGLPGAAWTLPEQTLVAWAVAFAGVALLLAPRGLPGRWLGGVLVLPALFLSSVGAPGPGGFRFTLLDVGQGLAAVVQTRGHTLVYDTGPGSLDGFNSGEAVIGPFLRARGVERIDRLIVSHADNDHAGGLAGLLGEGIEVRDLLGGEPAELAVAGARPCRAGEAWIWDQVRFQILHPGERDPGNSNDRSCVLRIEGPAGAVLLTGDAQARVERELVAEWGAGLRSDVLVAGHHGSATSTTGVLLKAAAPRFVLYSAGYRNRFGFPKPSVSRRVRDAGARSHDTARNGALEFLFAADGALSGPIGFREVRRRYWSHRPAP